MNLRVNEKIENIFLKSVFEKKNWQSQFPKHTETQQENNVLWTECRVLSSTYKQVRCVWVCQ